MIYIPVVDYIHAGLLLIIKKINIEFIDIANYL
jgi:hypothetical protein